MGIWSNLLGTFKNTFQLGKTNPCILNKDPASSVLLDHAKDVGVNASGFTGNLSPLTDTHVQACLAKFDAFTGGGGLGTKINAGGTISGVYEGDVYCAGDVTVGAANVVVYGNLLVVGDFKNPTGKDVTVYQDFILNGAFNGIPTTPDQQMLNLTVKGSMTILGFFNKPYYKPASNDYIGELTLNSIPFPFSQEYFARYDGIGFDPPMSKKFSILSGSGQGFSGIINQKVTESALSIAQGIDADFPEVGINNDDYAIVYNTFAPSLPIIYVTDQIDGNMPPVGMMDGETRIVTTSGGTFSEGEVYSWSTSLNDWVIVSIVNYQDIYIQAGFDLIGSITFLNQYYYRWKTSTSLWINLGKGYNSFTANELYRWSSISESWELVTPYNTQGVLILNGFDIYQLNYIYRWNTSTSTWDEIGDIGTYNGNIDIYYFFNVNRPNGWVDPTYIDATSEFEFSDGEYSFHVPQVNSANIPTNVNISGNLFFNYAFDMSAQRIVPQTLVFGRTHHGGNLSVGGDIKVLSERPEMFTYQSYFPNIGDIDLQAWRNSLASAPDESPDSGDLTVGGNVINAVINLAGLGYYSATPPAVNYKHGGTNGGNFSCKGNFSGWLSTKGGNSNFVTYPPSGEDHANGGNVYIGGNAIILEIKRGPDYDRINNSNFNGICAIGDYCKYSGKGGNVLINGNVIGNHTVVINAISTCCGGGLAGSNNDSGTITINGNISNMSLNSSAISYGSGGNITISGNVGLDVLRTSSGNLGNTSKKSGSVFIGNGGTIKSCEMIDGNVGSTALTELRWLGHLSVGILGMTNKSATRAKIWPGSALFRMAEDGTIPSSLQATYLSHKTSVNQGSSGTINITVTNPELKVCNWVALDPSFSVLLTNK